MACEQKLFATLKSALKQSFYFKLNYNYKLNKN